MSLDPTGCWAQKQKLSYMQGTLKAYNTNKIVIIYIDITTFASGFYQVPLVYYQSDKGKSKGGQFAGNQIYFYNIE